MSINWGLKSLLGYSRDGMLVAMRRDQAPPYRDLGPNLKIIKFSDTEKWIIRMDFDMGKPREYLYGTIITSLQNGEFMDLGRCPECHRFFIGDRRGQKYCNRKCTKAGDKRAAPARMEEHRKRIEENIKSSGLPKLSRVVELTRENKEVELYLSKEKSDRVWEEYASVVEEIERTRSNPESIWDRLPPRLKKFFADATVSGEPNAFVCFSNFMKLARKKTHSEKELSKLRPILKALGQGNMQKGWMVVGHWAGDSLEMLWESTTKGEKKVFEKTSL